MHSKPDRVSVGVRRAPLFLVLAALVALVATAGAGANVALTRVSSDPFTNSTSQHATEVEPDTFAFGSTVVGVFQVGRFFDGGGTDIGFVRSGDGGRTWDAPGFLPGMTFSSGAVSPYERVSDASVAFDAAHGTWLISSIPLLPDTSVPTVFINRSTDDGRTWSTPLSIPPPDAKHVDLDKNWTVCDNNISSPFRGHCYTEFDNFGDGDRELMSTSIDGGMTWSTPIQTAGHDKGLGGQPLVQPDGTVVVPYESLNGKISAFRSTDGGATWTKSVQIAGIRFHGVAGDLRTSPLPTAEIDGSGTVYVAWEDCRFRKHCSSNDIVFSKSTDGVSWSDPARIPIDPVTSTVDHFIPGLGVDPSTSGAGAHLALTYYFYPDANCGDALPARRRLRLVARRRRALGHRAAARRPDDARRDRPDVAGADDRRLHLDLVLGRVGRHDVPGRAAAHDLRVRRGDVRPVDAAAGREPLGRDEPGDDHGCLPGHGRGDGRDAPRPEERLTLEHAAPANTAGAAARAPSASPAKP